MRRSSETWVKAGLWAAWALLSLPLAFIRILPAVDYPDHLARIFLLSRGLDLPGYAHFYRANWALLPNLALDLIAVPLAKVMPVQDAGRLFVILLFGLTIYGGARLSRALNGSYTWFALLPALLVYNRVLAYGFLNFLFGLGLMLLGIALHIENRSAPFWRRTLTEAWVMVGLFACHLVALAFYVFCILCYEIAAVLREGQPVKAVPMRMGALGLPLVGVLSLLAASPTVSEASKMEFRPFGEKLSLLHSAFQTGQGSWDFAFTLLVAALVAGLVLSKRAKLAPAMLWPLIGVSALFLASPTGFRDAMNVDTRIPVVLGLLCLASLAPSHAISSRWLGACVLGLVVVRAATTSVSYARWNLKLASVMNDLRRVPEGSIVVVTRHARSHAFDAVAWDPPLLHLPDLLLLEKPFLADDLFAIPTQQPLLKNAPYRQLDLTEKVGGTSAHDLEQFADETILQSAELGLSSRPTYIYYLRGPGPMRVPQTLESVAIRPDYALLKVNPQAAQSYAMHAMAIGPGGH